LAGHISIGASKHIDEIRDRLDAEFQMLKAEGFKVLLDENEMGEFTFLGCNLINPDAYSDYTPEEINLTFRHYIANVLSELILSDWEKYLIGKLVKEQYNYFTEEERHQIANHAYRNLNHCGPAEFSVQKLNRKTRVLQKILEYLDKNNELVIDGFVKFRLKEYMGELQDALDTAVDEFLMEKEYNEFIRLLRYFVEIQEPKVMLVHVVVHANGFFQLFDGENKPVNSDYLGGFAFDANEGEINYEDLLISALISLAPKVIVLHMSGGTGFSEAVTTIKKVFGNRVTTCPGCERYSHSRQGQRDG
jgi:putative sporulation protein YtxC